jgi:L-idonate 5-dehydrogenase
MSKTMLAAVLHGVKDLRVEERPVPELAPGKVLLRLHRAGICGTDVHYFEEGRFGNFAMSAPFVLGHEITGEVVSLGDGVQQPAVGQRVVVNPSRQCGHCDYCRNGRGNLCRRVVMLGSASTKPPTNGAFSEYLLIGAEQCFPVPPQMDDGLAAMMEPFAVALHALKRAGSVTGKQVLVTGGGPIGLLTVITARAFGATTIALSDPVAERRQMALTVGADIALDPMDASFKDQVAALTGDGFDVAFEASGSPPALRQAFDAVRRGATLVQIGVFSVPELSLPINQLMIREIQFVGTFRYSNVWEEGIRLVSSGRVNLQPLISRVFPLQQAREALTLACAKSGVVKVQLDLLQAKP